MELDFLEKRFLDCITKCQSRELPINRTIKVNNDFELFQAYGVYNEVHEVIKRIKSSKIRLDDVAVFYTETNTYSQLFYDAGKKYGIPITFGDGIDIRNTTCGRLLQWNIYILPLESERYVRQNNGSKITIPSSVTAHKFYNKMGYQYNNGKNHVALLGKY